MALVTLQPSGLRLFYTEKGDGLPIVFLSGLGAGHEYWASTVRCLRRQYRCIVLDNRDIGQSSCADRPYDIRSMARDVAALLDHLGLATVHVVGLSMGGMIAQELAIARPSRVRSLVLAESTARTDSWFRATLDAFQLIRQQVEDTAAFFEAALPWWVSHQFLNDSERVSWLRWFLKQNPHPQGIDGFCRHLEAIRRHDALEKLSEICCPVQVMVGEDDSLTPPRYAHQIVERIPQSELVVLPGVGHAPPIEDPAQFNRCLSQFLDRHSARARVS